MTTMCSQEPTLLRLLTRRLFPVLGLWQVIAAASVLGQDGRLPSVYEIVPAPRPAPVGVGMPTTSSSIPAGYVPWWQDRVVRPIDPATPSVAVAPEGLVLATLSHSPQVRVLSDTVLIRQASICEAEGKFDVRQFAESKYISTNDPVGSTLTTGGPDRWIDSNWYGSAGLKKRTNTGADVEMSQKIGYEDSNSLYFVPPYQGTSRLCLRMTQPLLNGAGKAYNNSLIVLADINTNIARDRFSKDVQSLLLDVHRLYWELYLQRAALIQRWQLYEEAVKIRDDLNARRDVDALAGQIARAEAAVANRAGAVIRYQAATRNTEARIRAIVNDPGLSGPASPELLPNQYPNRGYVPVNLSDSLVTALKYRPEILAGIKEIRAAGIRADVAANEVLPVLNAIIETYVSGLRGYGELGRSLGDQFSVGQPSYTGGLQFEVPLGGNRTANARLQQRKIELRQASCQLEATTANVRAEVEIAVRDVQTAYREIVSKYHSVKAGETEIEYLATRWRELPDDRQSAGFALDELLSAQDRLAQQEFDFATAECAYNVALINLNRAMGTLVNTEDAAQIAQYRNHRGQPGDDPSNAGPETSQANNYPLVPPAPPDGYLEAARTRSPSVR